MKYQGVITFIILSILIVLSSQNIGIFWDNVLFVSKLGNHLYDNGIFSWGSIPIDTDSGHPPFLATIIAFGWNIFGKSLCVAHWMMLPFILGLLWQLFVFVSFFVKEKTHQAWAYILVIADPTLLSQLVLVNPEVIQLFFFFVALNGVLRNNLLVRTVGLAFLGIVSFRGMMLCAGIFFIDLLLHLFIKKEILKHFFTKRLLISYLIAAIPAISYLAWRFIEKGWIGAHPSGNWHSSWHLATVQVFLRNIAILGHRFIDFGRLFVLVFVLIALYIKRKSIGWEHINILIIIFFFSTIVIYLVSLFVNNPMGHRYFIPSYLTLGMLSFLLVYEFKFKRFIYVGLLCILLLGNFIVYPDRFSQGWDSSLAHLPYWNLRKNAIQYMDDNHLPIQETASFFPNATTIDNIDINGDMRSFLHFTGGEKYVFYSNVYNISNDEFDLLKNNYSIIKSFNSFNIRIELMQKRNY